MSAEDPVLDPHRLSVRSQSHLPETAENGDIELSPVTGSSEIPLVSSNESLRVTIREGETRYLDNSQEAIEAHSDYLDEKEDANLVLQDVATGDLLVIPHNHRWRANYREMVYAKIKSAERFLKARHGDLVPSTMMTLTAPHKFPDGSQRPLCDVLDDLKQSWNLLRRVIRRETEGIKIEMLTVYEPHKTGYPHLHVAIFGIRSPKLGEKIIDTWADRYVDGASKAAQNCSIRSDRETQIENPAAYLMKYLTKTLIRTSEAHSPANESMPSLRGYRRFAALFWATGSRMWSVTEGLSEAMTADAPSSSKSESDWVFLGTASGLDTGLYSGDEAADLHAYIRGSRNQIFPPTKRETRNSRIPPPTG